MAHVFISYSKQDIDFARHLRKLLNAQGFTVWLDQSRLAPSAHWWSEIEDNIEHCAALIVIMSPHARESDWVERELLYAERLHKPIFPVLLAGEDWPRLANLQYVEMRAGVKATLPPMLASELAALVGPVSRPSPNIPLPKRVTPPSGDTANAPKKQRRRVPRFLLLLALLVIAAALVIAFDAKLDAWLFGERDNNSSGEKIPAVEIVAPPPGSKIPIHADFVIRVQVSGIPHPMILQFWFGDELINDRMIDADTHTETLTFTLPEPGLYGIRAQIVDGEHPVADHIIEVFGVEP